MKPNIFFFMVVKINFPCGNLLWNENSSYPLAIVWEGSETITREIWIWHTIAWRPVGISYSCCHSNM